MGNLRIYQATMLTLAVTVVFPALEMGEFVSIQRVWLDTHSMRVVTKGGIQCLRKHWNVRRQCFQTRLILPGSFIQCLCRLPLTRRLYQ